MSVTNYARNVYWRAIDAVLVRLNDIDVSDCKTPNDAKRRIYGAMIGLRPRDLIGDSACP